VTCKSVALLAIVKASGQLIGPPVPPGTFKNFPDINDQDRVGVSLLSTVSSDVGEAGLLLPVKVAEVRNSANIPAQSSGSRNIILNIPRILLK